MKKKTLLCIIAVCAFFILGSVMVMAEESEIPNIIGTWKGTGEVITDVQGKNPVAHKDDTAPKPRAWTFIIDKQDGRTFSGTRTSSVASEKVIGVISYDNKSLYMVDEDGSIFARLLSENQMELVYLEIIPGNSRVVAIQLLTKEK